MTAYTKTIEEARDHILKKINRTSTTEFEDLCLEWLNDAAQFVATLADWKHLRKKSTITFADATGAVALPNDLDRIMAIPTGSEDDTLLIELSPTDFELAKLDTSYDRSTFFATTGYTQTADDQPPQLNIEVYAAPAAATSYTIWYQKVVDELGAGGSGLDIVPNYPPHIWDLIIRKATLEGMRFVEMPISRQNIEMNYLDAIISQYKARENYGSAKLGSIKNHPGVVNYKAGRSRGTG